MDPKKGKTRERHELQPKSGTKFYLQEDPFNKETRITNKIRHKILFTTHEQHVYIRRRKMRRGKNRFESPYMSRFRRVATWNGWGCGS